jgi:hypothetical protein
MTSNARRPASSAPHPPAEGSRLGEAGRAHHGELGGVDPGAELPGFGHPERVRLAVQVEAGHGHEADAVVEDRPRLAGEHGHLVAQG